MEWAAGKDSHTRMSMAVWRTGKGFVMKKFVMKKRVICMAMLVMAALFGSGCSAPGFFGTSGFIYDNAEKYTMGGAELAADGIETLDIGWVSGEVKVAYHSENTVVFSETANKTLDENTTMYYMVDGDTLRIKFAKSGKYNFTKLEKELTVWLPQGMELAGLEIDSVSADVSVAGLVAERAEIDTTSGEIVLDDVTLLKSAKLDSTSGDIRGKFCGSFAEFSADTVSGKMELALEGAEKISLDTTSGSINLAAEIAPDTLSVDTVSGDVKLKLPGAGKIDLDSTSGDIRLTAQSAPDALSVDTVSGDVVLCLPENADFTVRMDSVSGRVESELTMKKDGDDYIFGAGTKKYDVDTTSGDLKVECE